MTKKQLEKVIREYYNSEVKRLIKKYKKTVADKMKVQDYIMLSLYEYIQVRNDFANMIVLTKKEYNVITSAKKLNYNYYIKDLHEFHFFQFKTSKFNDLPIVEKIKSVKIKRL